MRRGVRPSQGSKEVVVTSRLHLSSKHLDIVLGCYRFTTRRSADLLLAVGDYLHLYQQRHSQYYWTVPDEQ